MDSVTAQEAASITLKLSETVRIFAYKIGEDQELVDGRWFRVSRSKPVVAGRYILPAGYSHGKRWQLVDGQLQEYAPPPDSAEVKAQLRANEIARLSAGIIAKAELALAMKGDGALLSVISDQQFDALNEAGRPVSEALGDGQFKTALSRWRKIFSADSTAAVELRPTISAFVSTQLFSDLNAAVVEIIKAKIKEWDGLTDEQLAAL